MKQIILLILIISFNAMAQNTPCSRGKGGISHCEGAKFRCNDGSLSASKKVCSNVFNGISDKKSKNTKRKIKFWKEGDPV